MHRTGRLSTVLKLIFGLSFLSVSWAQAQPKAGVKAKNDTSVNCNKHHDMLSIDDSVTLVARPQKGEIITNAAYEGNGLVSGNTTAKFVDTTYVRSKRIITRDPVCFVLKTADGKVVTVDELEKISKAKSVLNGETTKTPTLVTVAEAAPAPSKSESKKSSASGNMAPGGEVVQDTTTKKRPAVKPDSTKKSAKAPAKTATKEVYVPIAPKTLNVDSIKAVGAEAGKKEEMQLLSAHYDSIEAVRKHSEEERAKRASEKIDEANKRASAAEARALAAGKPLPRSTKVIRECKENCSRKDVAVQTTPVAPVQDSTPAPVMQPPTPPQVIQVPVVDSSAVRALRDSLAEANRHRQSNESGEKKEGGGQRNCWLRVFGCGGLAIVAATAVAYEIWKNSNKDDINNCAINVNGSTVVPNCPALASKSRGWSIGYSYRP